jgi:hypothetical protein
LWLAETSQQPISQTTWLKVIPHCNHCNPFNQLIVHAKVVLCFLICPLIHPLKLRHKSHHAWWVRINTKTLYERIPHPLSETADLVITSWRYYKPKSKWPFVSWYDYRLLPLLFAPKCDQTKFVPGNP